MAVLREKLEYGQLTAANAFESLLNLNDGIHFYIKSESFKVLPAQKIPVIAQNQRRWGGGNEVAETHENGHIEWTVGVSASLAGWQSPAGEQECIEKVEELLARLEANPYRELILWQAPGVTQATLYEVRGSAIWTPEYEWLQFEGANLFLFNVQVPIGPLAQGLPTKVYEKSAVVVPELIAITGIAGDAPALAEVSVELGSTVEEAFVTGASTPTKVVADASHVYWTNKGTGFIGRCAIGGGSVEQTWLNTGGEPAGLAIDASHIYWTDVSAAKIGRATIAGGTIEKAWIALGSQAADVAVDAGHVYFSTTTAHIGRAAIGGGTLEESWLAIAAGASGKIAIDSAHIYWAWTNSETGQAYIARATIAGASREDTFIACRAPEGLATDSENLYVSETRNIQRFANNGTGEQSAFLTTSAPLRSVGVGGGFIFATTTSTTPNQIVRAVLTNPPMFALLAWAATPTAGLAAAPMGILEAVSATKDFGAWVLAARADARGGKAFEGTGAENEVHFQVDPATMVPDSFSGEIAIEVFARVLASEWTPAMTMALSAQPLFGASFGPARYTDEWGSQGAPIPSPVGTGKWRLMRLGTLHMLANPLAPAIWRLTVNTKVAPIAGKEFPKLGLNYLLLHPSTQRACSPTAKAAGTSYPFFIPSVAATKKTVQSNLAGLIGRPGENGFPSAGLGGQVLELPPGSAKMLVKLSSLVPDDPTASPRSEQLSHEAKIVVWATPRWFIARTS